MPGPARARVVMGVVEEGGIWWCDTLGMILCCVMTRFV